MNSFLNLIRNPRTTQLVVLLVLVCAVGLAIWSGNTLRFFDEIDYSKLAHSLLHQHAFAADNRLTMFRPPGYPLVLAAIYQLVDSPMAAKLVNCVALAASAYLVVRLSQRLYPCRAALAALAVLCYPLFLYAASTLYPQTIGGFLLLAIILQLSDKQGRAWHAFAGGVLVGVLCLLIPSFLYILPLFGLYVMYERRSRLKTLLLHASMLGLGAAAIIAPWTIRNAIQFGAFVPISGNSGYNLALGNSAITPADRNTNLAVTCPDFRPTQSEVEFNREMTHCAVAWMRANPGPAFVLYVQKFLNYFNFRNELITPDQVKRWQEWLIFITYYPLLILALVRLFFWKRYPLSSLEVLLYVIYVGNAAVTAIFFTRLRFRIPFDLLLTAIDSAFVMYWLRAPADSSSRLFRREAAPVGDPG
jgi:hypothetical protein